MEGRSVPKGAAATQSRQIAPGHKYTASDASSYGFFFLRETGFYVKSLIFFKILATNLNS